MFSGALTLDRPIARSLARPLNPLPNFSPTCSLAHFPASLLACSFPIILINPQHRKKNFKQDRFSSRLAIYCCLHVPDRLLAHFFISCVLASPDSLARQFLLVLWRHWSTSYMKERVSQIEIKLFSCVIVRLLAHFLFVVRSLASSNQIEKSNRRHIGSNKQ